VELLVVELVLVYCLIGDPVKCVEQRPMFEQPLSAMACMVTAQQTASHYVDEHPQWRLATWRCERDQPKQRPA
jgi:hypothetical protein